MLKSFIRLVFVVATLTGASNTAVAQFVPENNDTKLEPNKSGCAPDKQSPFGTSDCYETEIAGMGAVTLTDKLRGQLSLDADAHGVVVMNVADGSAAFAGGIVAGDLITEAAQQRVETAADFNVLIQENRNAGRTKILLLIRKGDDRRLVSLPLND